MKHEALIKRVPLAKEISCSYNGLKEEEGILITVESDCGIHHIHLSADYAVALRNNLNHAIESWESSAYHSIRLD